MTYCSKLCDKQDWADHRLHCTGMRDARAIDLAAYEARGGQKKGFNQHQRDVVSKCKEVLGLENEIMLLAWNRKHESPLIHVSTSENDVNDRLVQIKVMPCSFWEKDARSFP
jgi:hypothetical protein